MFLSFKNIQISRSGDSKRRGTSFTKSSLGFCPRPFCGIGCESQCPDNSWRKGNEGQRDNMRRSLHRSRKEEFEESNDRTTGSFVESKETCNETNDSWPYHQHGFSSITGFKWCRNCDGDPFGLCHGWRLQGLFQEWCCNTRACIRFIEGFKPCRHDDQ